MDKCALGSEYLASIEVVDWFHPDVRALAWMLAGGSDDVARVARSCFEWVRDEIEHSVDFGRCEVTCRASDVLNRRTGFCYAKSHLLAALLRANGIPAGFCYQRLSIDGNGPPFCLHGLNAVWLAGQGWYRIDARGNRLPGNRSLNSDKSLIDAQFTPPIERLAFRIQHAGEANLPEIYAEPLPVVVEALSRCDAVSQLAADLPDAPELVPVSQ